MGEGIDLSSVRTIEDLLHVVAAVLAAVGRGEIAPAEAAHIAERAESWRRAARRLARLFRGAAAV